MLLEISDFIICGLCWKSLKAVALQESAHVCISLSLSVAGHVLHCMLNNKDWPMQVLVHLEEQSPDIGQGVHGLGTKTLEEIGAGDQGHMFGYATDETEELMPLTHVLATRIGYKLTQVGLPGFRVHCHDPQACSLDFNTCKSLLRITCALAAESEHHHTHPPVCAWYCCSDSKLALSIAEDHALDAHPLHRPPYDTGNPDSPCESRFAMALLSRTGPEAQHWVLQVRKDGSVPWLRPDGKTQVTIEYKKDGGAMIPIRVHTILISTQHSPDVTNDKIHADLMEYVIKPVVPSKYMDDKTIFHLNPSGAALPLANVAACLSPLLEMRLTTCMRAAEWCDVVAQLSMHCAPCQHLHNDLSLCFVAFAHCCTCWKLVLVPAYQPT